MPLARRQVSAENVDGSRLVFIDDVPSGDSVNGQRVLTYEEFRSGEASRRFVAIAVADPAVRQRLAARAAAGGLVPWSVQASNVEIMDDVEIAEGALLSPFVVITSNVRIGRYFHANLYSYVEHDCRIGDFVTFAPGVKCNGNVVVEDGAYIGAGAILRQGTPRSPLRIGRGAVVGMGAIVTRDVEDGVTVVGNPARPITERG